MSTKRIGAKIVIDGEREFRSGMTACKTALSNFKSELGLVSTKYKENANSLEALKKKQEVYGKIQEQQSKKVELFKDVINNANKEYKAQEKALGDAGSKIKEYEKALENTVKEYGEGSVQAENLKSVIEESNAAYKKQEAAVQNLSNRINIWSKELNDSEKELEETNQAIAHNNHYIDEAENSYLKTAKSIDRYGDEVKNAGNETVIFSQKLSGLVSADLIASGIKTVTKSIAHYSAEIVKASFEVGASFEAQMSKVKAISGATGKDFEALTAIAEKMGATTKFTATEAGQGLEYMAMAGWDAKDSIAALPAVLNLAAAAGEELGTTSDIVTDAMTAFKMEAGEASHFADVLAAAATSSNTNVSMMGETFKYVAPVAGALGYRCEDTSIAIGLMANAGVKASSAGTALRSIITRLSTDAGASSKKLGALGTLTKELGVEFYNTDGSARKLNDVLVEARAAWAGLTAEQQTNYANTIAGKNAISGWMALMNASEADVRKVTDAIEGCDGAAKRMADTMNDNLKGKITIMNSALEGLGISFYKKFETPMKNAIKTGTDGIDRLNDSLSNGELGESVDNLAESVDELSERVFDFVEGSLPKAINGITWVIDNGSGIVGTIEGIGAAYFTYTAAVKANTIAQELFNKTLLSNPMIAAATAATGLIIAYGHLLKTTDGIASAMSETTKESKKLAETSEKLNNSIRNSVSARKEDAQSIETQAEVTRNLADELDMLNSKTELTAAEQSRMVEIVNQLNSVYPALGLSIDEHTGKLNMDTQAIYENIDAQVEAQKSALAREHMTEITKQQFEAQMQLYELNNKYEIQQEEVRIAEEKLAEAKANSTEIFETNGQTVDGATYALKNAREAESELKAQIDETNESIAALSEEYDYCNKIIEDTSAQENAAAETKELSEAAKLAGDAFEEMSEEAQKALEDFYKGVHSSIESSLSVFDKFTAADKQKADEMIKNAQSQIDGYKAWGDSFEALAGRIDDDHKDILTYLANLGVQGKGYIDALLEIEDVNKFTEALDTIKEALEIPDDVTNRIYESWINAGENMIDGAVEGVNKNKDKAKQSTEELAEDMNKSFTDAEDMHSPSKVWEEYGNNLDLGLINGVKDTVLVSRLADVSKELGKTVNNSVTELINIDKFAIIGGYIPDGLAQGIRAGRSNVEAAAMEVAKAAADAARRELDIHSPSGVFEDIGLYTGKGFVKGWDTVSEDMVGAVNDTMSDVTKTAEKTTSGDGNYQVGGLEVVISMLGQCLEYLAEGQNLWLDGKTVVGATISQINNSLGRFKTREEYA